MAKRKKKEFIPICLQHLNADKRVSTYLLTKCTESSSDKLYIMIVVNIKKKLYLVRCWGANLGSISAMYEEFDRDAMQKLVDEKGEKGYVVLDHADILLNQDYYNDLVIFLKGYIDTIPTISPGVRQTLM